MPVPPGFMHAHALLKPSRVGAVVGHSDLVEVGATTCVGTYMAGP